MKETRAPVAARRLPRPRPLRTIQLIVETGRPVPSTMAFLLAMAVLAGARKAVDAQAAVGALPMLLVAMASFMMNDLWDRTKDTSAQRQRPLAQGLLTPREVLVGLSAASALALFVAWLLWPLPLVLVAAAILSSALLYSPLATAVPVLKNPYAALLCCSPVIYAHAATGRPVFSEGLLVVAVFIFGRELLLDVKDHEGDWASGQRTLPFYLRLGPAAVLAWLLMGCSLLLLLLQPAPLPSRILRLASALGFIWALHAGARSPHACERLRVPMLLGAIGVGIG